MNTNPRSVNPWTNRRLLVVDDNPSIHEDFRKVLTPAAVEDQALAVLEERLFETPARVDLNTRFEIDCALQGSDALALVEQAIQSGHPYAMAFVDIRMPPGWDGVETIKRLWAVDPELQVVICTAYSDYDWDDLHRHLGVSDRLLILKKPFDNLEALQLAHALTEKWSLQRQARARFDELETAVQQRALDLERTNAQLAQEIAERRQAEAALRRSEERFAKAFRASPIPLIILRLEDGRVVDTNESWLRLTGRQRQELLGKPAADAEFWIEPGFDDRLRERVRQERSLRNQHCQLNAGSGSRREVLLSAEVFDLGSDPHLLVLAHDITDRLALENQLRQAQKMESVGQLAAGVAHDFNNLLTVIQGHTSLLLEEQADHNGHTESLEQIFDAAQRAASLTRQLLAFSRKQLIQPKPIDVNDLVSNLAKLLERLIGENITLRLRYSTQPPMVYADAGMLEQVIMNLCVNSRDAMPEGGELQLVTEVVTVTEHDVAQNSEARAGAYVRVTVADTRHGMDSATLNRIFEPFFTTKGIGKGTGLGLATVYGIVKQHEGWVEVSSAVGQGTSFRLYLPFTDRAKENARPGTDTRVLGGNETILVVEDEPALQDIVASCLRRQGYRVLTADNGVAAQTLWSQQSGRIDLLLTDMIMPNGVTGKELALKLRGLKPALKVIYTSGYSAELQEVENRPEPGVEYLAKPYTPSALAKAVRGCLDS